jgi:hypothetical protein
MQQLPSGVSGKNTGRQLPRLQSCQGKDENEVPGNTKKKKKRGRMFCSTFTTPTLSFAEALKGRTNKLRNQSRHETVEG